MSSYPIKISNLIDNSCCTVIVNPSGIASITLNTNPAPLIPTGSINEHPILKSNYAAILKAPSPSQTIAKALKVMEPIREYPQINGMAPRCAISAIPIQEKATPVVPFPSNPPFAPDVKIEAIANGVTTVIGTRLSYTLYRVQFVPGNINTYRFFAIYEASDAFFTLEKGSKASLNTYLLQRLVSEGIDKYGKNNHTQVTKSKIAYPTYTYSNPEWLFDPSAIVKIIIPDGPSIISRPGENTYDPKASQFPNPNYKH